jgi:diadenosine tetraphosphate (Ap4A) HIT family hydrolase
MKSWIGLGLRRASLEFLWAEVAKARALLVEKYQPDGFNVGVNDGAAAGQTIVHAHVHGIPRRRGDAPSLVAASAGSSPARPNTGKPPWASQVLNTRFRS